MKKQKKIKCKGCKKRKATYECEMCGDKYCWVCAKKYEYECGECSMEPPQLIKILD